MAHNSLQITGGVVVNETPALNSAGISKTQLVRLKPDPKGLTLVEKLGGWSKFYATQITSTVRALLGWEDTNANKWIAYGTSSMSASQLVAIQCFTNNSGITTASTSGQYTYNLTPQYLSDSFAAKFQTVAGSSTVTVTDNVVVGLSTYDSVFISTPVSVGGLILFGQYAITSSTATTYTITATNIFGNPVGAAYTTVASPISITSGSYSAGSPSTLTLGFGVLGTAPFTAGESVNIVGVNPSAWNGSCIVQSCTTSQVVVVAPTGASGAWVSGGSLSNYGSVPVLSATSGAATVTVTFPDHGYSTGSTFTILNQTYAGSLSLYGNYIVVSAPNAYTFTINASSNSAVTATNYLNALTIVGGSSTTTAVTLNLGQSTYVIPTLAITSGTGTGSAVTLNWSSSTPYTFPVGSTVYVTGITAHTQWNGSYTVTGSTSSSVTYNNSTSGSSTAGGTASAPQFQIGGNIQVSGIVTPSAWNGNYTVTSSTPTTVTYALSGSALSWMGGGVVSDIGGDVDFVYNIAVGPSITASGWGIGGWGAGGWGTGQTLTLTQVVGQPIFASNWALDNWGEVLLSCPVGFTPVDFVTGTNLTYGPIYTWDPALQQPNTSVITNGPPASTGFFVAMPQRQIVAWGTTFNGIIDPLLVRWCDVSNYNVWVGQITNQAGSYRLSTGSAIIGALQAQQQGLLWTDVGLWAMQYIGPPYVYSFNQIAQGCGLIARRAMGVMNNVVYWMGSRQFFTYGGEGVTPITCPIWDVAFQNLDLANLNKITVAVNSLFGEVTWYYPVIGGNGENSAYIRYNAMLNAWDFGSLGRTAWLDNSILGPPIGFDPVNQYIYQHEISPDADGSAINASFTTGYFAIAEGDNKAFLDEWWSDFKWGYYGQAQGASVQITFNACDFPGQVPTSYGPYTVTQNTTWFNPRIRARLISITVSSNDVGTWWRMGNNRYRVQPDGRY